jgi:hypothetical protein
LRINLIWVAIIASFLIINSARAENKTGVTDSLNAGEIRFDLAYVNSSSITSGTFTLSGSPTAINGINAASTFQAAYLLGVTDRLNVGIKLNLAYPQSYETDYTVGANSYTATDKFNGPGDPTISAQYLVMEKEKDNMGMIVSLLFTPPSANSNGDITENRTNGVITTPGVTGGSGNGFTVTNIGTVISFPFLHGKGDVYSALNIIQNGTKTVSGVTSNVGNLVQLEFGVEKPITEKTILHPYGRINSNRGGYSGTTQISSYTSYDLGAEIINDVSKRLSIRLIGEYNLLGNISIDYANGDVWTYSGKGYTLGFGGSFFF